MQPQEAGLKETDLAYTPAAARVRPVEPLR
jgi:hypothetical protein